MVGHAEDAVFKTRCNLETIATVQHEIVGYDEEQPHETYVGGRTAKLLVNVPGTDAPLKKLLRSIPVSDLILALDVIVDKVGGEKQRLGRALAPKSGTPGPESWKGKQPTVEERSGSWIPSSAVLARSCGYQDCTALRQW